MSLFSRNLSILFKYSRVPICLQKFRQGLIRRNVQTVSSSLSAVPSIKRDNFVNPVTTKKFNFESLGSTQQKMEVNGLMLNWDIVGNGDHVVLMLPGILGTTQNDFGPIFPKMDLQKYTLVSWDPPGYGRSRPPVRDYLGEHQRTDGHLAVRLMKKLGFDKFSVIGWSNGGVSGLLIAADFPSKVKRLITIGAFAYADLRILNAAKNLINFDNWHPKMLEPLLDIYDREYLLQTLRRWYKSTSFMYLNDGYAQIKKSASKVQCPTLIFHGEKDPISGIEQAEFLKNNIPNSRLCVMPKAGHNMHLRYTDEFISSATQFLES